MYSGGFYPYPTTEKMWAVWSRNIYINRYMEPPKPTYQNLLELVKGKDYFVLTTNVDHCLSAIFSGTTRILSAFTIFLISSGEKWS